MTSPRGEYSTPVLTSLEWTDWPQGTVTFMLSDVESSARLWEQYTELMAAALERHDAIVERAIAEHNGVVVRPRGEGDSRFAVFTNATDAVRAACAIQLELAVEPWPIPEPLRIRIGVHTGPAQLRASDYYGTTVNRCARLRDLGAGGQILCSSATAALVRRALPAEAYLRSLGSHRLRGLREAEVVFELLHPRLPSRKDPASVEVAGSGYAPAYPFPAPRRVVGRESELAALEWLLARGQASGQTLFLSAPAGTGKSTLLGRLARRATELGVLVLAGGSYESEALVPLRPFRDALGDYLLARSADAVRSELGDLATDLAGIVPELRHHLQLPLVDEGQPLDQIRLFGAITALLRDLAGRTPLLLCLEDLHVTDPLTLELLQYLSRQLRRSPVTIVGTVRSDEVVPGQPLAQLLANLAREGAEQIALPGLDRDDTGQLAASLLDGSASRKLVETLFATTEGNPLFIEQLVLALQEEQRLNHRGGVWHAVGELRGPLPSVIREVLLRRVDRLSEGCRDTLALIAVLGHSVDHERLMAVAEPRSEIDVVSDLDEALGAQVLREVGAEYAFRHGLLRQAIYWSLSGPRRMLLHARVARAEERLAGDNSLDIAAELAHHFVLSGSDPVLRSKALHYSVEAGRRAAALSSHNAALVHFRQAYALIDAGAPSPAVDAEFALEVLEARGQAECNVGMWEACVASSRMVLERASDPLRRARAHRWMGRALEQLGQPTAALDAYTAGLHELGASSEPEFVSARVRLRYDEAFCHLLTGRFRLVQSLGLQLLEDTRDVTDSALRVRAHNVMALACMWQGQVADAQQHFVQMLANAEASSDRAFVAVAHENLGANLFHSGRFDEALDHLQAAIQINEELGSEPQAVLALQILSLVQSEIGNVDAASKTIGRAIELAVEGHDRWTAECLVANGLISLHRGDVHRAELCFTDALTLHEEVGHLSGSVEALLGLGSVAERTGDLVQAEAHYRRAVEIVDAIDPGPLALAARRQLGLVLLRQNQLVDANAQITSCVQLAETMPESVEYAPTVLALAELVSREDADRAIQHAERGVRAARTATTRVQGHLLLATAYARLGNTAASRQHSATANGFAERAGSAWLRKLTHEASLDTNQALAGRVLTN